MKKYFILNLSLIFSLLLSNFVLLISPQQVFAAKKVTVAKVGVEKLADPYFYEKISPITDLYSTVSKETPKETVNFEKPVYGFNIDAKNQKELESISFIATLEDGSTTDRIQVRVDGDVENILSVDLGKKPDTSKAGKYTISSQLFVFEKNIKSVEIFYTGTNLEYSVNKIDNVKTEASQLNIVRKASIGDQYASDNDEHQYKKALHAAMGINMFTREEWGAPVTSGWAPTNVKVSKIIVHHTAGSVDMGNPKNTVLGIYNYHKNRCSTNVGSYDPNNPTCDEPSELWQDIGYNYLIDPYGQIYEGRAGGNGVIGAHAGSGKNYGTIGIALLGNYTSQLPTQAAVDALARLSAALSNLNGIEVDWGQEFIGHRNITATACPGNSFYPTLPNIAGSVNALKATYANARNAYTKASTQVNGANILSVGTKSQILLNINNVSNNFIKNKLLTKSRGVSSTMQMNRFLIYSANSDQIKQLIAETTLVAPESKPQPNYVYKQQAVEPWDNTSPTRSLPADYNTTTHWNLEKIKAPEMWKNLGGCTSDDSCGGSQTVKVAIVDTGVAYENFDYDAGASFTAPTKINNFLYHEIPQNDTANGIYNEGYDRRYSESPQLSSLNIVDPYDLSQDYLCYSRIANGNPDYYCNDSELEKILHANDDAGHGTFIAHQIAALTSNTTTDRIVGIAHNVKIMPIKVTFPVDKSMCLDSNGNLDVSCSDPSWDYRGSTITPLITLGIYNAVDYGANVINISMVSNKFDQDLEDALIYANTNGVVVVTAAGNNNSDVAGFYPASSPNVITVGASTSGDVKASYSNYGSKIDVVAPAGNVADSNQARSLTYSCFAGSTCSDESNPSNHMFQNFTSETTPTSGVGTSFAAPQVTALAAILKSKNSNLTSSEVKNIITTTAIDLGTAGKDIQTGYGNINLLEAIENIWSNWILTPGTTNDQIASESFNERLFQSVRGSSYPYPIWIRSTADGVFNGSDEGESWTQSGINGKTLRAVSLASFDNGTGSKLYLSAQGTDGNLFMKSMDTSNVWSSWYKTGDIVSNAPGMKELTVDMEKRLYQALRGAGTENILIRYTTDGIFDKSSSNELWTQISGKTTDDMSMEVFNVEGQDRLYLTAHSSTSRSFLRYTSDGVNWQAWTEIFPGTSKPISMTNYNGKLYLSLIGAGTSTIYTLYSKDGSNWSSPIAAPGYSSVAPSIEMNGTQLFNSVRGGNGSIFLRNLVNTP